MIQMLWESFLKHGMRSWMLLWGKETLRIGTMGEGLCRHSSHWGRGPMETGVYMLGTFQALSQSSSNVPTRYISFTFQM